MADESKLRRRRVLLEVETSLAPGRDMLRGIAKFIREVHRWDVHHDAGLWSLHQNVQGPSRIEQLPAEREVDGIITRIYDEASEREALENISRGVPVVDLLGEGTGEGVPLVHTDDGAIAKMALGHLREQGFREFAFVGMANTRWSDRRRAGFEAEVEKLGAGVQCFEVAESTGPADTNDLQRMEEWIEALPKPVAIFASCDHVAPLVLESCSQLSITVPEHVAVIGVNNDTVACNVCSPTLSSVDASHFEIGYRAARLLEDLMDGGEAPGDPIFIRPREVIVRGSSGEAVIDDPLIARAARFISRNAASPIGVDDVVNSVPLSRRELQRRFRSVTGTTVHEAICSARIQIAKRLLASGEYTIDVVAEMSGFGSRQHFAKTFRNESGMTPAQYRKELAVR